VKKVIALIVVMSLVVMALFLLQKPTEKKSSQITVAVSTFALYDIVKHIGGENVRVEMVIPFGVEVHSFEPTPKTIMKIQKSDRFFYSGANLEPWVKKLAQSKNMRDMSHHVKLIEVGEHEHEHVEGEHHHELYDPHYWLSISNMQKLNIEITSELMTLDPKHKDVYLKNSEKYLDKLTKLQRLFAQKLQDCKVREVVMHHNTLAYVASTYNFEVLSLTGLSPDALADAKTMTILSDRIKKQGISTIFFEAFVSDKMMQNLAKENGVHLDYIEPLANITATQADANMSYVQGMQSNLIKLSEAMQCR